MRITRLFGRYLILLLLLFTPKGHLAKPAFTGTYGINYGRLADNIPSPEKVVSLLRAAKIKNVRIFDFEPEVLKAFSGSGLELVVGLPNGNVKDLSANADNALTWVKENVQAYLPKTKIVGITVGNEILGGADAELQEALVGAVRNIYNATQKLQIADRVQVQTAHSQAVFANSFPPSSCIFRDNIVQYMKPLLELFSQMGSPFCLNAYPFLAYMGSPDQIDINYALFESTAGIIDNKTYLHYDNMLDAMVDATYAALDDAGFKKMEVIVTETGWASRGDQNEAAATLPNARTYNYNLRKRLAKKKGTPMRPKFALKAYTFAIFNEDSKPGPTSERNFGLFKPDGTLSYDIGFPAMKSSSATSSLLSFKEIRAQGLSRSYASVLAACITALFLFLRS